MNEFFEWLKDRSDRSEDCAIETRKIAPNSYGAGYDLGFADALRAAREKLAELTLTIG
jgi:hypothetical protein